MYRTLLVDFDGTLTPSLTLWLQAFQYALDKLGRTVPEDTIIKRFYYRPYEETAAEFDLGSGKVFEGHVMDGLTITLAKAELFPGALDMLEAARELRMAVALVTSSPRPQVMSGLRNMGIEDAFDVIVSGDDVRHFKPHPEPVFKALHLLERGPDECLFVGDYTTDVLAGHAAGVHTALHLPAEHEPFYDFEMLRATRPTFTFTHYAELIAFMRRTNMLEPTLIGA
ncbi:pyrophosphatase PpaX [Capsulimonas corticalis]|uniref:Pyrophosphatase PpaX n=1 Tax=Capsulimonas corticalis TaxID=2219043 RepID=A0A402CSS7_9BACT|nr:HAD-IA family hydrolase [Capsulimonas corticalis]BDI30980.1 pyrophosphatase PpaX [Capsulimonas corticalis]